VQVAAKMILELSLELRDDGRPWPHPWDHYPFLADGAHVWLRYRDLSAEQREQVRHALVYVRRRLGPTRVLHGSVQLRQAPVVAGPPQVADQESH
jgi:hypothetical protein